MFGISTLAVTTSVAVSIIWANIAIKGVTALASTPLIYTVRDRWVGRE
mgnify:CR=1 FL=1